MSAYSHCVKARAKVDAHASGNRALAWSAANAWRSSRGGPGVPSVQHAKKSTHGCTSCMPGCTGPPEGGQPRRRGGSAVEQAAGGEDPRARLRHHGQRDPRRIDAGVVHDVVRHHPAGLVVVVAAGVQVAVEARKVTAGDFYAQPVAGEEIVAEINGLEGDLVDLSRLHPDGRFVVAVAVAHALDVFGEVE